MNIFVGNMSFDTREADLKKLFEGFGSVTSVVIVMDEKGKKSRGFGFITMADGNQAQKAILALDGRDFMGRPLRVNPSIPKSDEAKAMGDQKEARKRIKAENRIIIPRRGTVRTVRPSAVERREQPKHWQKREERAPVMQNRTPWQKREERIAARHERKPWEKRDERPTFSQNRKPWQGNKTGGYKR
jgi:RNA recognition motif-containing protein